MFNKAFAMALVGACLFSAPAMAQQIDSAYTDLNLDKCTPASSDDLGGSWACQGYKGYPVYVAEGDLRMFVSYGDDAANEMAASQTLPQFNTVNTKLEWRLIKTKTGWAPFATILRFFTQSGDGNDPDGQVLVVTSLAPGNVCHVAYIDARRIENANVVARQFADSMAMDFDCQGDEAAWMPE